MSWLDEAPALAHLDDEARRRLSALKPMDVPKGAVLFEPGEAVKGYVVVLSGRIGVYLIGPTGRDILLYRVEPGGTCIQSTLGLLTQDDYSAEATAETGTRLVLMPKEMFLSLIHASEPFREIVFGAFAERMQSMMHLLERVAFQKVESRLAAYLLREADGDGCVHATQAEIGTSIGSAREVVSRRLEALARRNVIRQERGLVQVLNTEWLHQLAEDASV